MNDNEFTKLFNYMTERFDKIDQTLEIKANSSDLNKALVKLIHANDTNSF